MAGLLKKNPVVTSSSLVFKSSEVFQYTVINGTLKQRCIPGFPVEGMQGSRKNFMHHTLSFNPYLDIFDWESQQDAGVRSHDVRKALSQPLVVDFPNE